MLEPLPKDAANLLRRMLHRDPLTRRLNAANSTDDKGKVLLSMIARQGSKSGAKKPAHLGFLWNSQRGLLQPSAWKTHTWRLYGTGAQPEESYRCRRQCRVRSQGFATQNCTSCLLARPSKHLAPVSHGTSRCDFPNSSASLTPCKTSCWHRHCTHTAYSFLGRHRAHTLEVERSATGSACPDNPGPAFQLQAAHS